MKPTVQLHICPRPSDRGFNLFCLQRQINICKTRKTVAVKTIWPTPGHFVEFKFYNTHTVLSFAKFLEI